MPQCSFSNRCISGKVGSGAGQSQGTLGKQSCGFSPAVLSTEGILAKWAALDFVSPAEVPEESTGSLVVLSLDSVPTCPKLWINTSPKCFSDR